MISNARSISDGAGNHSPEETSENSRAFQRWVSPSHKLSPRATAETLTEGGSPDPQHEQWSEHVEIGSRRLGIQEGYGSGGRRSYRSVPSLRALESGNRNPSVETLGYSQSCLRHAPPNRSRCGGCFLVLGISLLGFSPFSAADPPDEIGELKKQVQELDQKIKVLERNRELETQAAETNKKEARLTAGEGGFSFGSADSNFVFRVGAHIQADARFYLGDHIPVNDTFLLRRVRPIFEGTVFKDYDYRLMLDFGANTPTANTVQEAYINARYSPELQLLAGKFKPPVGLERLQTDVNVRFIERGYPTGLVPNRDVGVELHGDIFGGALTYEAAILNGVADGGSGEIEQADDHKDYAGRLFAR